MLTEIPCTNVYSRLHSILWCFNSHAITNWALFKALQTFTFTFLERYFYIKSWVSFCMNGLWNAIDYLSGYRLPVNKMYHAVYTAPGLIVSLHPANESRLSLVGCKPRISPEHYFYPSPFAKTWPLILATFKIYSLCISETCYWYLYKIWQIKQ